MLLGDKMDCLFCKIIANNIPSYTIYEDDTVKVLLDINPHSNGHLLIVPRTHFKDIEDIDLETLKHINQISKKMYVLLQERLHFDGLKIVQNNGISQDIKHYHIHMIPVYKSTQTMSVEEVYNILKK